MSTNARALLLFYVHDAAPSETHTLSLHDALPILGAASVDFQVGTGRMPMQRAGAQGPEKPPQMNEEQTRQLRSEEHTSELQSRGHLVCRLLLEKKKQIHLQLSN